MREVRGKRHSQQQKLMATVPMNDAGFGASVAISRDTVVVGAPGSDSATRHGAVYVFVSDGKTWDEQTKLIAPDGEADDRFGRSVTSLILSLKKGAHYEHYY